MKYDGSLGCSANAAKPYGEAIGEDDLGLNGLDDDYDGCVDNGLELTEAGCTCVGDCKTRSCSKTNRPVATCDPYKGANATVCGQGKDSTCAGTVDRNCSADGAFAGGCDDSNPKDPAATMGSDPILLASRSAVTAAYADFQVDTGLGRLEIARTYASSDGSYIGGATGIFGRGWHHDWEAWLSCTNDICTVARGLLPGFRFTATGAALSIDGTETWTIYKAWAGTLVPGDGNHQVLARRPGGEWILFTTDGREFHFGTVCDSCAAAAFDQYCVDPTQGGS